MQKQTVAISGHHATEEIDWGEGSGEYIVASATFDAIVSYDAAKDVVDIDTDKLREFMLAGQRSGGQDYLVGTRLPMRACRGLGHYDYWPLLADEWELDLDVIFHTMKNGELATLKRDGYGWDDYFDRRYVHVFPQEFFDCFGEGNEGWRKGWQWLFEHWLIRGSVPESFDLTKVGEVLEGATKHFDMDVVWVDKSPTESTQLAATYYKLADPY